MSVSSIDVTNPLYDFEKRHNLLLEKTGDGIYYWTVVRDMVLVMLWKKNGLIRESEKVVFNSPSAFRRALQLWDVLVNELNFLFCLKKKKVAFISIARNIGKEQRPIDLMLEDYMNTFEGQYNTIEVYSPGYFKRDRNKYTNRYFNSRMELKKRLFPYADHKVADDFSWLADLLNEAFDMDYDWNQLIKQSVYDYRQGYNYYKRVFRHLGPEVVFYTVMIRPAVAAANDLGIVTVEVLHGCPSPTTLTWSMSNDKNLDQVTCAPKFLFTFSEYWHRFISDNFKKIAVGNNFFYSPALVDKKRTKAFTVISSIYTFQSVIEIAYKSAVLLQDHHFYIKLQSAEIDHIKVVQKMFEGLTNYTIIFNEYNVNELFDRSDYVLLVQSSCTYQAIQKRLHVFIYKRLYYNDSEDVFDLPHVHLIDNEREVKEAVDKIDQEPPLDALTHFFNKYDQEKVVRFVNEKRP